MKTFSILLLFAIYFAGCTTTPKGDGTSTSDSSQQAVQPPEPMPAGILNFTITGLNGGIGFTGKQTNGALWMKVEQIQNGTPTIIQEYYQNEERDASFMRWPVNMWRIKMLPPGTYRVTLSSALNMNSSQRVPPEDYHPIPLRAGSHTTPITEAPIDVYKYYSSGSGWDASCVVVIMQDGVDETLTAAPIPPVTSPSGGGQ